MTDTRTALRDAATATLQWLDLPSLPNEAVVRQVIVLRTLQAAGFDIWDPREVIPEETNAAGTRPDFIIKTAKGRFALEIKGAAVNFQARDYAQVAAYAGGQGMRWAMLTNGRTWEILDERANGAYPERVLLRLTLSRDALEDFVDDIHEILLHAHWRDGIAASVIPRVAQRIKDRALRRNVIAEKRPLVLDFQTEHEIGSFEKAADLAVKLGLITSEERSILIDQHPTPAPTLPASAAHIPFTYQVGDAKAQAHYTPSDGKWTVLAGSQARAQLADHRKTGILERRERYLRDGTLIQVTPDLMEFTKDVPYDTPSAAAQDVAGASRNGWTCWQDEHGNLADTYRSSHP